MKQAEHDVRRVELLPAPRGARSSSVPQVVKNNVLLQIVELRAQSARLRARLKKLSTEEALGIILECQNRATDIWQYAADHHVDMVPYVDEMLAIRVEFEAHIDALNDRFQRSQRIRNALNACLNIICRLIGAGAPFATNRQLPMPATRGRIEVIDHSATDIEVEERDDQ